MTQRQESLHDNEEPRTRVKAILDECFHRHATGEPVSFDSLIADYPDLMPQLGEELNKLRLIWAAQERAQKSPDNVASVCGPVRRDSPDLQSSSTSSDFDGSATLPNIHATTPGLQQGWLTEESRIGPYQILGLLGEGGYGVVYLAEDVDLERPVAIKIAKLGNKLLRDHVVSFLDEARRVAQLQHPSIVKIFDVSRNDPATWYLVMEYIEGPSLAEVFAAGNLSIGSLVELLIQVAEAIHYAHSNGIFHRDLKPANVLLDRSETNPRIVDFGMALHEREQLHAPRRPAGTPYCMAPEQVRGETHRLDARTDIWAIGVMLYEGLTGTRPFVGENVAGLFDVILREEPRPLADFNACIPTELQRICLKCLSKRMGDRYATAAEIAHDLRQWLGDSQREVREPFVVSDASQGTSGIASAHQVVPKGLRSFSTEDADFFLDLLPGPRNRDGIPESISMWVRAIENSDHRSDQAVLVLYGPTGSGKSSFVRAGLVPHLRAGTSVAYVDSSARDIEQHMLRKIHQACRDLPMRAELVQACTQIRTGTMSRFQGKMLIVLDQFEQWLHANDNRLSGELAKALRQCDGERLQCLIVVRSDFWLGISRFLRELDIPLIEGRNSAHLELFDIRHTRHVMEAFGRSCGCLPPLGEPLQGDQLEFLEQAAEQIATDGWVVPVRLALFVEMMKGQKWELKTLTTLGGEQGLRVAYLDQIFCSPMAAPRHRRYRTQAEAVLKTLLSQTAGELKGRCRTRYELKLASGLLDKEEQFSELLDILDLQLRLITPTEEVETLGAADVDKGSSMRLSTIQPSFQLTHDYLVPALREWLTREEKSTRAGRARLCLDERDRQWRQAPETRYLPSLIETIYICALTDRKSWSNSQSSLIHTAVWRQLRLLAYWVSTTVVLSILFLALYFATRPPDPLSIFQNSHLAAAVRVDAFDRLDLTDVAALGPVLYTMKYEHDPEVLRHSIEGMSDFIGKSRTMAGGGGDSVRDLILTETGELLGRDKLLGGSSEDSTRATLFSMYAALAPTPDVLQFAADALERNRRLGSGALTEYLRSLDAHRLFLHNSGPDERDIVTDESDGITTSLVRLMAALPSGDERAAASELLRRLPVDRLVTQLTVTFSGKAYQYAKRSADIYVTSLPTAETRRSEAQRIMREIGGRVASLVGPIGGDENSKAQLAFLLASIQYLQPAADYWDQNAFDNIRAILLRRDEYRDSDVIDIACEAYASLYATGANQDRRDLKDLAPLREMLADKKEDISFRCAAAKALGAVDDAAVVNDLGAIAKSVSESVQLRAVAITSLGSIGRQRLARNVESPEIIDVLVSQFDTGKYGSIELVAYLLPEIGSIGRLDELASIMSVLSLRNRDLNLLVHDAVFAILLRFPRMAEQIAEQTLVAIDNLSDDGTQALFPPQGEFLADVMKMRRSLIDAVQFEIAFRQLSEGLANLSSRHSNPSVRRLAHENLGGLLPIRNLPDIDPDGAEPERLEQLKQWHDEWLKIKDRLYVDEDLQIEVR